MKKSGFIFGGIFLLGLWASYRVWNVKESIRYFQYGITGLKFNFSNLLSPVVTFSIQVYNPNKTSVPVNQCFGTISYKNAQVAVFNTVGQININGQETVNIPVSAKVSALSVITSLLRKNMTSNLFVEGMIKTSLFDFPISKTIPLKV